MSEPLDQVPQNSPNETVGNVAREQEDLRAFHLPRRDAVMSFPRVLAEAVGFPGRYKSPSGIFKRLTLEFQKRLAEFGGTSVSESFVFGNSLYPIPPQWQTILDYLFVEGVISSPHVIFEPLFHDEPKIFSLRLFSVFNKALTDGRTAITSGHSRGVSYDFEEAISKVIGEFLERYPLTIYRRKDFTRSSMNALSREGRNFLNVHDLAGFADWQKELYTYRRFDDRSNFFWAEGQELLSDKPALLPAQLIFWNYNTWQEPAEPYLRQPITNGAAGHFTSEEAILAGMYENIQRDAFLIHWLNAIPPPRIDPATIKDTALHRVIEQFSRYDFEVVFLNTTLDLKVPSCTCVLIDTSGRGPRIAVGGGCGPSLGHSLMRSATEAAGVYHWLRLQKEPFTLGDGYLPFRDPNIGQEKRLLLWSDEKMFPHLESFLSGRKQPFLEAEASGYPQSFASSAEELRRILQVFSKKGRGYEVYVYKAKHRLLDVLGYSSVKVVIPALFPLYLNERDAPLGSSRLRSVPVEIGLTTQKEFNPWPHPFP